MYALTSGGDETTAQRGGASPGAAVDAGGADSPADGPETGGGPSKGAAPPPDKYTKVPLCSEAAGSLPLPDRNEASDRHQESRDRATNSCAW
ncbi:hypothetical protein [Streptomyces sp. NPDC096095]|uniref:hypothetical protein n=1 Tax=Streptomyces sp. NPDC096095 TaxID=3155545 RepID=UPI003317F242